MMRKGKIRSSSVGCHNTHEGLKMNAFAIFTLILFGLLIYEVKKGVDLSRNNERNTCTATQK